MQMFKKNAQFLQYQRDIGGFEIQRKSVLK